MSKATHFPKYNQLTFFEKFILTTCCYYPPKPRRIRGVEIDLDYNKYTNITKRAFGNDIFKKFEGKKVLDFGCGEGGFSLAIAKNCKQVSIDGIDIIDGFKKANEIKVSEQIDNLNLIIGYSSILPDEKYDYILSHDSFEHFEDPDYILSEMERLTKPEGSILIKFGPAWAGPYGRHMGGTYRKDRPWIHLIFPEKNMMRVHSVYHNRPILFEKYTDLEGGLNKMTYKKAVKTIARRSNLEIVSSNVSYVWGLRFFRFVPYINELFTGGVYLEVKKKK